jgi:CDGSH iron-sulfur domain-containing protein 3
MGGNIQRTGPEFELEGGAVEEVEIEVRESGSYRVRGPVRVVDADGNKYDVSQKLVWESEDGFVALCRCGRSSIKPFCDGTHKRNGFKATEREPDGIWRRPPP